MANSIFLAKLIGPIVLAVGIALCLDATGFRAMVDEVMRSRPLVFISGVLYLTAGLAIILTHNVWIVNWPLLITLIGWFAAVNGGARILIADKVGELSRSTVQKKHTFTIGGAILCVFGILLCFFGYLR